MLIADIAPSPNFSQIGVWVIVLLVLIRGVSDLRNVIDWLKGNKTKHESHKDYKTRFVTREELNGSLLRLEEGQNKMQEKVDKISEDVAVLKSRQHRGKI
jgi:hypothetical protein